MTKNSRPIPFEEIEKLLEPLINLPLCDRTTLTNFQRNRKTIIAKMSKTGFPVLLHVDNQVLLLCDPTTFAKMENRRQWVLQGCKKIEQLISVGHVDFPDQRISKLAYLKEQIANSKKELEDLRENATNAENQLATIQEQADALARELDSKS